MYSLVFPHQVLNDSEPDKNSKGKSFSKNIQTFFLCYSKTKDLDISWFSPIKESQIAKQIFLALKSFKLLLEKVKRSLKENIYFQEKKLYFPPFQTHSMLVLLGVPL